VNGFIQEAEEWADEAVGSVATDVADVERALGVRPGGKIDTARRMADEHSLKDYPVAETDALTKGRPIAVDSLPPESGIATTVTLSTANPVLQLLPRDTTRRSAVLLAVDNDVYVSTSPSVASAAAASNGATFEGAFYLPAKIGVPWQSTAPLWAAPTTTASVSRISVMASYKGA
jgi:hypothetical protein